MMWFLEHLATRRPRCARRGASSSPAARITAIEVDYSTVPRGAARPRHSTRCRARWSAAWRRQAGATPGTRLPGWLPEAGFRDVEEGERPFRWQDEDLAAEADYAADVLESALDALARLPGVSEEELRAGLERPPHLSKRPGAGLGWVVHKSTALR